MERFDIGKQKEVLWDMALTERSHGVRLQMHKLTRKGSVLETCEPWEGDHAGYAKIVFDGEKYRFYYRGGGKNENGTFGLECVAYSYDGKTFEKPNLGIYEYNGSKENNIVMMSDEPNNNYIDNFSIMLDENPACEPDAKYKAFWGHTVNGTKRLIYFKSSDGFHFERVMLLDIKGYFDSMNIAFYDHSIGKYRLYMRDFHDIDENNKNNKLEYEAETHVRDIRLCFSDDFIHWTEPAILDYNDPLEIQLYTNNIMRYGNSNMYIGLPTRYIDRAPDAVNYKYIPGVGEKRWMRLQEKADREFSAVSETMLMVSRDGYRFNRSLEAFFTPGVENGENWIYGDGYFAYGMIETASDFEGEPNELSLYVGHGYRTRPVTFERYTIRMDGFYSWRADFEGGEVITKPLTFQGSELSLNFATSALGYLRIEILDQDGAPIEGYDSGRLFGDSTARHCDFEKPLSDLEGKEIRFKISMKDCDFYSFKFH